MMVTVEFWQLVSLLLGFFGCVGAFGKLLLVQFERRQNERFGAIEKVHEASQTALRQVIQEYAGKAQRNAEALSELERSFLRFQADLPVNYVRREDYMRGQSVIEAKLDALYSKLEVVQMREKQGG